MTNTKTQSVFITGTSSGIGKALALVFAENNWNVIASMRNVENFKIFENYSNIKCVQLDISDHLQIKSVVSEIVAHHNVNVLINNAGYGLFGPFEGISEQQIQKIFNTNVFGTMALTQEFLPYFRQKKSGTIINISSIGGLLTFPFNSVYHATKWAIEGWSESLFYELKEFGITIKTICPGNVETDFATRSLDTGSHEAYDKTMETAIANMMHPEQLKTYSEPEEIALQIFEITTNGNSVVRNIVGNDAKALNENVQSLGIEKFREIIGGTILGNSQ